MPMRTFELLVFEQPFRDPKTEEEVAANAKPRRLKPTELPVVSVRARNVDEAMKQARTNVEKKGHLVRSVAVGPDGIVVVVYRVEDSTKSSRTMKESRRRYG